MISLRSKYFDDYDAVPVPADNKKGYKLQYRYVGDWCVWTESPRELSRRKKLYGVGSAFSALLPLFCGGQRAAINTSAFVAVPGLLSLVALMYAVIGAVQICKSGPRVPARDHKGMSARFSKGHFLASIGLLLCGAGGIVTLFINGIQHAQAGSILVLMGYFAAAVSSFLLFRYHKTFLFQIELGERSKAEGKTAGDV